MLELHFYKLSMCSGMFPSKFQFPKSHGFTRLSNSVLFSPLFLSFSYNKQFENMTQRRLCYSDEQNPQKNKINLQGGYCFV